MGPPILRRNKRRRRRLVGVSFFFVKKVVIGLRSNFVLSFLIMNKNIFLQDIEFLFAEMSVMSVGGVISECRS